MAAGVALGSGDVSVSNAAGQAVKKMTLRGHVALEEILPLDSFRIKKRCEKGVKRVKRWSFVAFSELWKLKVEAPGRCRALCGVPGALGLGGAARRCWRTGPHGLQRWAGDFVA